MVKQSLIMGIYIGDILMQKFSLQSIIILKTTTIYLDNFYP